MTKIDELEKKRAERLEARAKKKAEQYEKDLEARIELEDEHGTLAAVQVSYVEGHPTMALVRRPDGPEYKRFKDLVGRYATGDAKSAKKVQEASETLGRMACVYPAEKELDEMIVAFPGLLTSLGNVAGALAQGAAVDEGKD